MAAKSNIESYFLSESPLFSGLQEDQIKRLVELAELQEFDQDEVIVTEGSQGDALFLLYDGEISVCTENETGETVALASLRDRGAFFGEIALVDPGPRAATVRADSSSILLKIGKEDLEKLCAESPDVKGVVMQNIALVLAQRLRDTNVKLSLFSTS